MKLIKLSAIASTNSYLREMTSELSLEDETVVWANSQTSGRGQMGASWYSEPDKSLTFSLLKRYSGLPAETAVSINLAVSLGLAKAMDILQIPSVAVKWPNDIMSDNKKIAGILIENQLQGNKITSSVVGLGINVNNDGFTSLPNAGSLYLATGMLYDLETVLRTVLDSVLTELHEMSSTTFESLQANYQSRLFRKGVITEFKRTDGTTFKGTILGITKAGNLEVSAQNGDSEVFRLKEIELQY